MIDENVQLNPNTKYLAIKNILDTKTSKILQEFLFSRGYAWTHSRKKILTSKYPIGIAIKDKKIYHYCYFSCNNTDYMKISLFELIDYANKKTK